MAATSGGAPRERKYVSEATLSLFALALSELSRDVRRLLDTQWDEPVRRRAEELSTTLFEACRRQGLEDLVPLLRAVANLSRLSKADAIPLLPALREKFGTLLRQTETLLPKRSRFLPE
jgi:hypothetical protein